ncbi:hypothetical protein [Phenylobacterium sp.]|nr:hypothetical protein [Phenylobacterium sp.]MDP1601061.1 hypothetical protein [Phenylobacterium sp.]MDP3593791.1 hypothetical protein [Phenylobacterium sp.]
MGDPTQIQASAYNFVDYGSFKALERLCGFGGVLRAANYGKA